MSGIIGILRTDGTPVDAELAKNVTSSYSMRLRGPDAQAVWCHGPVALGHTLLRTTDESQYDKQPFSLDGRVWIVADARVDARVDLIGALRSNDEFISKRGCCDAELILRAYHRWGDACVEHLLGDFAFAIWDGVKRRLLCVRDHMGVKPFYYANVGSSLLFGSTIESLHMHPEVSDRLNDLAIADFLLFGCNQEHATTSFLDIQRLPPAHLMTWDPSGLVVRRYWTLPIEEPVYYRKDGEYIDEFNELVRRAVADRLRTTHVGVFMSGGLDSTTLAAASVKCLSGGPTVDPVQAFTYVFDSLMPDSEREYAGEAARHLGIPIHYYALDERNQSPSPATARMPEPVMTGMGYAAELLCYSDMAAHSRVALYGEGPDNALTYEWRSHLVHLLRSKRLIRLAADLVKHVATQKRVPLIPTIPRMLRERKFWKRHDEVFPSWLAASLVDRLQLRQRWKHFGGVLDYVHPSRPRGYASLLSSRWERLFETFEPSYTRVPIEVRHPFVDIRLLGFLLRVPAVPWCRSKYLERQALSGIVPEAIRRRPKTPLSAIPNFEQFKRSGLPVVRQSARLSVYSDACDRAWSMPATIPNVCAAFRFAALSDWLSDDSHKEEDYGRPQEVFTHAGTG